MYSFSISGIDLCTRCGSSGFEKIIYCQYCSQPYHWFCAEVPDNTSTFTCPLCVACNICNKPNEVYYLCRVFGNLFIYKCTQCNGCKLWFHKSCLLGHTSDLQAGEKEIWKCIKCTKCISCHRNTPNKVSNNLKGFLNDVLTDGRVWIISLYFISSKSFLV